MRSSIACVRCRRSKVKCVNNGVNTKCRSCENSNRECNYPPPASHGGGGVRRESIAGQAGGQGATTGETPRRSRPKKTIAPTAQRSSTKESPRALVDALDWTLLTPQVWTELFEIFKRHFAADLPFFHGTRFLSSLRQSNTHSSHLGPSKLESPGAQVPPASHPLLLAFLALTARFHEGLVAHHSPGNPLVASEYYASAARARLESLLESPTLERTQALLMLGLYEWGMRQGVRAWMTIGVAVRSAQALGLQFEQDLDDMPLATTIAEHSEVRHMGLNPDRLVRSTIFTKGGDIIEQEIRRRTFWSCFIMDRYLSSGKYRPSTFSALDLRIQLPCSDDAFLFGHKVQTALLGADMESATRIELQLRRNGDLERSHDNAQGMRGQYSSHWDGRTEGEGDDLIREVGEKEGILSRFIKALNLYSDMMKWSCGGGRRTESLAPWEGESTFYKLHERLRKLKNDLPPNLALTNSQNIEINVRYSRFSPAPYVLMHTIHLLCSIVLHREYVPFIPLNCRSGPVGPLDHPRFDPTEVPPGFWVDSARELFKSGRQLIDLLGICQEGNALVETPLVGFAAYQAAFSAAYALNFPWMDPDRDLCGKEGGITLKKGVQIIGQMRYRLPMAKDWFSIIHRSHRYYAKFKSDFKRNRKARGSPESGTPNQELSLREGGEGGGLGTYELVEGAFKDFGDIKDVDVDMADADADIAGHQDDDSETTSAAVKDENMDAVEGTAQSAAVRQTQNDRWNAINTASILAYKQREDNGTNMTTLPNGQLSHPTPMVSPTQHSTTTSHPDYQVYPQQYTSQTAQQPPQHPSQTQTYPPSQAESAQRLSLYHENQLQSNPQSGDAQPWSSEKPDDWDSDVHMMNISWLNEDLAAFAESHNFNEYALNRGEGWMHAVFTKPPYVNGR